MKSNRLAALYNKFMKIHQSIFNHLTILLCYLHFTVQDILLETRIYKKYSSVVLSDTHWTVMVFHCYVKHFYITSLLCCFCTFVTHAVGNFMEKGDLLWQVWWKEVSATGPVSALNIHTGLIMSEAGMHRHSFNTTNQKWMITFLI
jgi:hypothetical protein